ncbi:MAG: hypothetical protein CBB68_14710 [Rhodospirillaceae bacterium TMED8]|nr:hypothetical protein [Magnetovibrio sp.]OUT47683.1 MAG: hypothetical protein CBB68_14710 [Rhodospirillaceae bacterium TMED8]
MNKSLNITKTDLAVWESVRDIVSSSSILKERVKEELLKDKDKSDADHKTELRNQKKVETRIRKGIQKVEESIAKIETDRMLERMDEKLYRQVKKNLRDELDTARIELEQSRLRVQETISQKRWINWVGKFHEMYDDVDHLSPEDRKEYIEGVVDQLVVHLNPDNDTHRIEVKFKFPIVGDDFEYLDPSQKSKGYDVIEGLDTHSITGGFTSEHDGLKKKTSINGLTDTRTHPLEQSPSQ